MAKQRFRDIKKGSVQPTESKSEQNSSPHSPIASVGDRIKAFITDIFMLMMPIMYIVFYGVMGSREAFAQNLAMGWVYILIPNFIIVTLFLWRTGQTPGAKAYKIKLVDQEGNRPSLVAVILRYYIELLSFISILMLIGIFILLMPLFRNDKRSLQDILSATHFITLEA